MPDLIYPVRPGDDNEELRYSLRSVVNLPHDNVWIVGHCPPWVRNTGVIELVPQPDKWANMCQSLAAACACEDIAEDIVFFNDDMFVLRPIDELPVIHLGPLDAYIEGRKRKGYTQQSSWYRGLVETREQMRAWGVDEPLAYEAHTPNPYKRSELGKLLADAVRYPFLPNCAYSATSGPVGSFGPNVKVGRPTREALEDRLAALGDVPFLSSEDKAFAIGAVGEYIRGLFPKPGPYERG